MLGRQGLWPGRRWSGKEGTAQALQHGEAVQIDPVSVVAESHDIALWGRVLDYEPDFLRSLAYEDRRFFDYGGVLFYYPMDELPYWRVVMERHAREGRWQAFINEHPNLMDQVRAELRTRGPLRNRDLDGNQVVAYRSSKDTGVALYALWMTGELMTFGRSGKERVYDFRENVAPAHLQHAVSEAEAQQYFIRKELAQWGLSELRTVRNILKGARDRPVDLTETRAELAAKTAAGEIEPVLLDGSQEPFYILAADRPLLEDLRQGKLPQTWAPLGPTTSEEVTFLSPLEYVSARGRALKLFDFDYKWEIYKPAEKRVYGPYTLPILFGDRLVGRMDARLDRPNAALVINGLWLEPWFEPDERFSRALAAGLARFLDFLGAASVDDSSGHLNLPR